jgi:hypothetical protein
LLAEPTLHVWPSAEYVNGSPESVGPNLCSAAQRQSGGVLWLRSEDGAEDMTAPRLMACGADLSRVIESKFAMQGGSRATFPMQDDIDSVKG